MEVWEKIKNDVLWFIVIYFFVANPIVGWVHVKYFPDDTDGPDEISHMQPHVDALTGCQYLSVAGGGITPRMDNQGKQICNKK